MADEHPIITRAEARGRSLLHYYTGRPCKNGHAAKRLTKSMHCTECTREKLARWHQRNPGKGNAQVRAWHNTHKDYVAEKKRDYRAANGASIAERKKRYYIANFERIKAKSAADYIANPEKMRARARAYYRDNLDKVSKREAIRRSLNKEKNKVYQQAWAKANPHRTREANRRRKVAAKQAVPTYANREAIVAVYREAERRTKETGILYQVDHIVPLRGRAVCGLHVHYNLRIITKADNVRKGNKLIQELALAA